MKVAGPRRLCWAWSCGRSRAAGVAAAMAPGGASVFARLTQASGSGKPAAKRCRRDWRRLRRVCPPCGARLVSWARSGRAAVAGRRSSARQVAAAHHSAGSSRSTQFPDLMALAGRYGLQFGQPDWLPGLITRYNLTPPPGS
jgi:hypothetical protein